MKKPCLIIANSERVASSCSELALVGRVTQIEAPELKLTTKENHLFLMLLGATTLQVEELTDHRQCRLGKWYYGDDSMDVRSLSTYKALEDPHRRVHQCGMDAVRLYNDGNHKGALAALEEVERASKDVISLLDRLAHEAGGTDASKAGQQPQAA